MPIDTDIARIREYRRTRQMSLRGLAAKAGLNESTIRHMDDDSWCPNVDTLRKLEAAIQDEVA